MASNNPKAIQGTNGWVPTPSDTTNVVSDPSNSGPVGFKYECCMIYTGAGGSIKVTMVDGADLTFANTPAGVILPIVVKRIWATPAPPAGILAIVGRYGV